jgi:Acetyltransferase (GNAT) family.
VSPDPRFLVAAENLILTYRELAGAVAGAIVETRDGALLCQAPIDLAFCNFAILPGDASSAPVPALVEEIARRAEARKVTRVFVVGEDAAGYGASLAARGFRSQQRMAMMIASRPTLGAHRLARPVVSRDERREVARFMIEQFFHRQSSGPRDVIVEATVASPHDLYRVGDNESILAAAMISRSASAWGLYNLCVAPSGRRRGVGAEIVRHLQNLAFLAKMPLTLQCEASLRPWYERLAFEEVGRIEAYSKNRRASSDIL